LETKVERQILDALKQINDKLDKHSEILKSHSEILTVHNELITLQSETLKEHTRMLSALKTGQDSLKAELNEMKLQNAKEFGEIKETLKNHETSIELLKEDCWNNKKDIRRIQKTIGMN